MTRHPTTIEPLSADGHGLGKPPENEPREDSPNLVDGSTQGVQLHRQPLGIDVADVQDSAQDPPYPTPTFADLLGTGALAMVLRQARQGQFDHMLTPSVLERLERSGAAKHGQVRWEFANSDDALAMLAWLTDRFEA
ncbi:MAG: hypothetical protein AMXMBFR64_22230 [Myxococcales bacterium]